MRGMLGIRPINRFVGSVTRLVQFNTSEALDSTPDSDEETSQRTSDPKSETVQGKHQAVDSEEANAISRSSDP